MKYKNFQDGFEIVTSYCKEKKLSRSLCNKIQIISAGMSGLIAAMVLKENGFSLVIFKLSS
jgi:ribulose 1,5-bisphosphate synthetase/thiazole synthase